VNWPGKDYCSVGHNCRSWAGAVRKKYKELQEEKVKDECYKEKKKSLFSISYSLLFQAWLLGD